MLQLLYKNNHYAKRSRFYALLFLLFTSLLSAGEGNLNTVFDLNTLVVSARGYESDVSETPGSIGFISDELILEANLTSLSDYGKFVPGVSKRSDGIWGSGISIRGLSRDSVVVLIDGARLETANAITARLGMIDPLTIDRIELLKGPISALYGSGSLGGVVNVITKGASFSDKGFESGFTVAAKSNPKGFSTFAYTGFSSESLYTYFSQTYRDYNSYKDGDDNEMINSQFKDLQSTFKIGSVFTENQSIEFQVQYYEGDEIGIPAGNDQLPAAGQKITYPDTMRALFNLDYTFKPASERWESSELKIYHHSNERNVVIDNFPSALPIVEIRPDAVHKTSGLRWQNILNFNNHKLVAGFDVWYRTMVSDRERELKNGKILSDHPLPDCSFTSTGFFAEDSFSFSDQLTINYGGRLDLIKVENDAMDHWVKFDEDDINFNAHIGLSYMLNEELKLKAVLANGYRAPTLEERYSYISLSGSGTRYGDPDLDSEESIFTEASITYQNESVNIAFSLFYNMLDNIIIIEDLPDSNDQVFANVNEAKLYGAEFNLSYYINDSLNVFSNFSVMRGKDTENSDELPEIPPFNFTGGVKYYMSERVWLAFDGEFNAKQDNTPQGTEESSSWKKFNFSVGYSYETEGTAQKVYISMDNITDEYYYDYLSSNRSGTVDLYEAGRSINAVWEINF